DFRGGKTNTLFDHSLEEAIRRFQRRHGLDEDGVIGTQVINALNVSPSARLHQIELNLERLRWVTPPLSDESYIRVNIPDFRLEVFEHDRPVLAMNVVVGLQKEWQTPSLSSEISYLILNPRWHVPTKIFEKELLEKIQKDPNYLEHENMKLYRGDGDKAEEVDTKNFKWNEEEIKDLRLIQGEGRGNALGRIKFMFKNPFDIYLHDTPQQPFFKKRIRTFSHGCIRVEKPMELAEYILRGDSRWTYEKFIKELDKGKNEFLRLHQPIPLHILYLTAWVDPDGMVQFREDVYGWDKKSPQQN
ncbi:MAG: L,D-transpeptidase family protein, partial [Deltaproteobacteria bacterium]|nr:L,D-transpeptidase family protein [Deltaproteobacteria bacterium]